MGILESIFFRDLVVKNDSYLMEVDIKRRTLSGMMLETPTTRIIETFGQPLSWWQMYREEKWIYPQLGIFVKGDKGIIDSFTVTIDASLGFELYHYQDKFVPFQGKIIFPNGQSMAAKDLNCDSLVKLIGKPDEIDEDEGDIAYSYDIDNTIVEFNFDTNRKLYSCYLSNL